MTALLTLPMAAAAVDFNSGIGSEGYWTDNVYSQTVEEIADYSVRVSPWGEVADADGDVTFSLRYGPSYEYWLDEADVRGFDHDVDARLAWQVAPATTLRLGDQFRQYHSLSRFNEQQLPGQDVVVAGRRVEYLTNAVNGSLEHFFTPRDIFSLAAYYTTQDFSERGQTDRSFYGTSAFYRHILTERTTIGASASWSRQAVDQIDLDERNTDYFNVSAVLFHEFSRSLHLEVSAGPALVTSDADDINIPATVNRLIFPLVRLDDGQHYFDADLCPRNNAGERILSLECGFVEPAIGAGQGPGNATGSFAVNGSPSPDDSTSTYFADVALIKDWERVTGELSYRRSEDQSSGFGAVSDIFYGSLRWQVTRRLSAKLITSYEIREQTTDSITLVSVVTNQPSPDFPQFPQVAQTQSVNAALVGSDFGLDVIVASLQLNYDLTPRSSVYSTILYRDEQSNGDVFLERDMQRLGIAVGIRYVFDPIDFDLF